MSSRRRDLEVDLGYLRDNLVQAIENGNSRLLTDGLATYEELVVSYMEVVGRFSVAADQQHMPFSRTWEELSWITDAYYEMSDAALRGQRRSILNLVMDFPIGVAYRAFDARNLDVFTEALRLARLCYSQSTGLDGEYPRAATSREIAEYFGLRIHEILAYRILGRIEREDVDEHGLRLTTAFADSVVVAFSGLLKAAYDGRQPEDFAVFARDLYDVIQPGFARYEFAYWRFDDTPLSARQEAIVSVIRLIEIMSMGLDAWLLREVMTEHISPVDARRFREVLMIPDTPKQVWNVYSVLDDRSYDRQFGWSWWEMPERAPRRAYFGGDFTWLVLRAVVLRLLERTVGMDPAQIEALSIDISEEMEFVLSDDGPALRELTLLEDSDAVRAFVDFDLHAQAELLRPLVRRLHRDAVEMRSTRIKNAPLSADRITTLHAEVASGWRESGALRAIFREIGRYQYHDHDSPESVPLGIHRLDHREAYIEPSRFDLRGAGAEYGRAMANGEDRLVVDTLVSELSRDESEAIQGDDVGQYVSDALSRVASDNAIILLVGMSSSLWPFRQSDDFERTAPPNEDLGPDGFFRGHAVYQLQHPETVFVIVVDPTRVGLWHQYRPDVPQGAHLIDDVLFVELTAFDRPAAEVLLEEAPDTFAFAAGGQDRRTREEQLDLVLQSVRLRILEKLRFEIQDAEAGRVIEVSPRTK
jgi:hypothetical protein